MQYGLKGPGTLLKLQALLCYRSIDLQPTDGTADIN